jgi:hypothetical protein
LLCMNMGISEFSGWRPHDRCQGACYQRAITRKVPRKNIPI